MLKRKARRSRCSSHWFSSCSSNLIYIPLKTHLKATALTMMQQLLWLFTTLFQFPSCSPVNFQMYLTWLMSCWESKNYMIICPHFHFIKLKSNTTIVYCLAATMLPLFLCLEYKVLIFSFPHPKIDTSMTQCSKKATQSCHLDKDHCSAALECYHAPEMS